MVNYDLLLLLVFYLVLLVIFRIYRNKFEIQWKIFALYKTKLGLNLMDKIARKYPNLLMIFGYFGIFIGFIGMIFTFGFIIWAGYNILFVPKADAMLAPVLPGIAVSDKLPILSFWHWIIAILIVAVIHEFSHGVYARLRNIPIKSSGFAFLGPILAAFVEPDEKQLKKKSIRDQLLVFSAGPFSNIVLGFFVFFILSFVFVPLVNGMVHVNGVVIGSVNETLPIANSGLVSGYIIQEIEGKPIENIKIITEELNAKKPGDLVEVKANDSYYQVELASHPENESRAFLGLSFSSYDIELKERFKGFSWLQKFLDWFVMLLFWTFNISIGVGLFNLLPLGPVDGGRMFHSAMLKLTKNERKAMRILSFVSMLVLFIIFINMWPFFVRLIRFIISPF